MSESPPQKTWKQLAADWLFAQGVSTVLLVVLVATLIYVIKVVVPEHIAMIQEGYREQRIAFQESLKQQAAMHESTVKYIMDSHRQANLERRQ